MSILSPQRMVTPSAAALETTADDVLAGTADAAGVRQFIAERAPALIGEVLRRSLPSTDAPSHCTVTRSKLKPGRKLTVSAEVGSVGLAPRAVSATWTRGGGEGAAVMSVLVSPLDPAFPQLVDLHDTAYLSSALAAHGVRITPEEMTVRTVRYRPGQRHVLRLDGPYATVYAKCYRDGTGIHALRQSRRIAGVLRDWGGPADVGEAVGYVERDRLVLWRGSDGVPLSRLVMQDPALAARAGGLLRAVHDSGLGRGEGGASDPEGEAAATARSCEHLIPLAPEAADLLQGLLTLTAAELGRLPQEGGHLLHGDFKCDNILVEGERLRIIDLDRVTVGDPALDVGKLTADLRWWALQDGVSDQPAVAAFLDGYGPCPPDRLRRARHYDVIFQLRAAGRRIALHEPQWERRVARVITSALRAAERAGGGSAR